VACSKRDDGLPPRFSAPRSVNKVGFSFLKSSAVSFGVIAFSFNGHHQEEDGDEEPDDGTRRMPSSLINPISTS
jgi:hypothetical protein